jgi:hypothetical protein
VNVIATNIALAGLLASDADGANKYGISPKGQKICALLQLAKRTTDASERAALERMAARIEGPMLECA